MAIAFRGVATSTGSLTCNKPTGTVDTDLMVAFVRLYDAVPSVVGAPAGWTQIGAVVTEQTTAVVNIAAWYKVAAGEGSAYAFTSTGPDYWDVSIASYSGADTVTPIDTWATAHGRSGTATIAGLTTAIANEWLVAAEANFTSDLTGTPTGYTAQAHWNANWALDRLIAAAGAVSDVTQAISATDAWVNFTVAIRPPGAADPFPAGYGQHPRQYVRI